MKVGIAFPEHIKIEKIRKRRTYVHTYGDTHVSGVRVRGFFLPILILVCALLLLIRLFVIQIGDGSYYRSLSDSNRIKTYVIHAPRGIIFDKNKIPLVLNTPGFRKIEGSKTTLLNFEDALPLLAKGETGIEIDSLRKYPFSDEMPHVLGYIGQISEEQLASSKYKEYGLTDFVGKSGIEQEYEKVLRGTDGKKLVEIDAMGKQTRLLGLTDPIPGHDITLTLDSALQKVAYDAVKKQKKAVVIISTPTGEILSLVSIPAYDANLFTLDKTYKTASDSAYSSVGRILTDGAGQPLLNRAIAGTYPPGSTFKLITAAAGLDSKKITKDEKISDTGILKVGDFSYTNWYFTQYGRTEGDINIVRALARSNDIFFYKLAEKAGVDTLSDKGSRFGLGQQLSIDLPGEAEGILPSSIWKKKFNGENWYLGDTYHYGIGQGYTLTTPLQVNAFAQVLANGGSLYRPHLLSGKPVVLHEHVVSPEAVSVIRDGMIAGCSPGGVVWPLFKFKVKNEKLKIDGRNFLTVPEATSSGALSGERYVSIACKTGTAQHGGEKDLPHAWITLFAPAYNPEIVVTVLVESSGEGSNVAAPIAKEILRAWFGDKK